MSLRLCSILLFAIIAYVKAQKTVRGACPDIPPMENFDEKKFSVRWYQWSITSNNLLHPITSKCNFYEVSPRQDNDKIIIASVQRTKLTGYKTRYQFMVKPQQPGAWKGSDGFEYRVVATDYDRYAVVFACNTGLISLQHDEFVYILTREREPDHATVLEAQSIVIYDLCRSLYDMEVTDQENCPDKDEKLFSILN